MYADGWIADNTLLSAHAAGRISRTVSSQIRGIVIRSRLVTGVGSTSRSGSEVCAVGRDVAGVDEEGKCGRFAGTATSPTIYVLLHHRVRLVD
ncbi:hypothetical protein [Nocardia sp. NBC_01009]|uniref:hypothetical protein n=1 Tax=Nocardia sp. NBC_01009 TaxID=2975996 RepID=UPI00386DFBF4|nr:hypothetical protein OHA42_28660 [Nocardia sp. NBC_01009]